METTMKNTDYLSWDQYFMGIATLSAKRSKDPHTRVGACIVAPDNRILSVGYNGMPRGCSDDEYPWDAFRLRIGHKIPLCLSRGIKCTFKLFRFPSAGGSYLHNLVSLQ